MKKVWTYIIIVMLIVSIIFSIKLPTSYATEVNTTTNTTISNTLAEKKDYVDQKLEQSNFVLQYVQSELSTALLQTQELNDNIEEYQTQINELNDNISQTEEELEEAREKLQIIEQSYKENYELLEQRMVALYEAGESSYLDVLLQSSNLIEFISNYFLITQLAEYDNDLLNQIEYERKTMELTKGALEEKTTNLKELKAKKEQTALVLENTKTMQEVYTAQLTQEEKEVQTEIQKYVTEQRNIEAQIQFALTGSKKYDFQYTGGQFIWPVGKSGTYITSEFGNREHPIQGVEKLHSGIDIGNAGFGAPVLAAADGVVTYAGWLSGYGNCVMIKHSDSLITLYGHGQTILATVGKQVKQGETIMEVGSTGNSTGPHLHFEVRLNGTPVNPLPYLEGNAELNNQTNNSNTNVVNTNVTNLNVTN